MDYLLKIGPEQEHRRCEGLGLGPPGVPALAPAPGGAGEGPGPARVRGTTAPPGARVHRRPRSARPGCEELREYYDLVIFSYERGGVRFHWKKETEFCAKSA